MEIADHVDSVVYTPPGTPLISSKSSASKTFFGGDGTTPIESRRVGRKCYIDSNSNSNSSSSSNSNSTPTRIRSSENKNNSPALLRAESVASIESEDYTPPGTPMAAAGVPPPSHTPAFAFSSAGIRTAGRNGLGGSSGEGVGLTHTDSLRSVNTVIARMQCDALVYVCTFHGVC
jgi:hypothetical protein